jgi:nitroreductase
MNPVEEAIVTRRSLTRLCDPAPSDAEVMALVEKAMTAPDHGLLRPWRLVLIRGEVRRLLGVAFADETPGTEVKPLRAPLLISIIFQPRLGHRVPEWEQLAATSAMTHNLTLLLHSRGWGSIWRTGPMTGAPAVRKVLELGPEEKLLGWLYVGTRDPRLRVPSRPGADPYQHVSRLSGRGLEEMRRCHVI